MRPLALLCLLGILSGCAVKPAVQNKYQLESFGYVKLHGKKHAHSIFVSTPMAAEGYETEQMKYVVEPFELNAFAKNAWVGPPARMLFALMIQSLQTSNHFFAVTSIPYSDRANFRLDTQLLNFHQSFLTKPSHIKMTIKNVVTNTSDGHVVSSRIFSYNIPCPVDAPYGGVLAANQATKIYTKELSQFVVESIQKDKR